MSSNIVKMPFPTEAQLVLERVEKAAKSNMATIKAAIPSLFLVGDKGVGTSTYVRAYDEILSSNNVYLLRGNSTLIELVFPGIGNTEKELERFFQSPTIVATQKNKQNRFYGTFAINLERWEGKDLIESDCFKSLLDFIDNNKDAIYFVFQVSESFEAKEELRLILNNHVNTMEVHLTCPDIEEATAYIMRCLEVEGIHINPVGKKELSKLICRKLDVESTSYLGFHSLAQIAKSIQFELVSADLLGPESMMISGYMIKAIADKIIMPLAVQDKNKRVGFAV